MNTPPRLAHVPHAERTVAITFFTPARFAAKPQVGICIKQEWHGLLRWLTWPSFANDKRAEGAWCPCDLEGGNVKAGVGPVDVLVVDVDDCSAGDFDRSADLCSAAAGAVIHTFSATLAQPKHRIAMLLDRQLTPDEFPLAWRKMARRLEAHGVIIDKGCKNLNRLYFSCVARSPDAWLGAKILTGEPLPVDRMLAAGRAEEAEAERARNEARAHAAAAPNSPLKKRSGGDRRDLPGWIGWEPCRWVVARTSRGRCGSRGRSWRDRRGTVSTRS